MRTMNIWDLFECAKNTPVRGFSDNRVKFIFESFSRKCSEVRALTLAYLEIQP